MKKAIKEAAILVMLSVMLGGITYLVHPNRSPSPGSKPDPYTITLDAVEQLGKTVRWIDARSKTVFEKDHIPNAFLLNEDAWEQLLPNLLVGYSPDQTLIVYCDSEQCDASKQVADRLRKEVGLQNVFTLKGGWQAWQARENKSQ